MKYQQQLDLTASVSGRKETYNPADAYSMLGTIKFTLLSYAVGLNTHNFHSKFDVL